VQIQNVGPSTEGADAPGDIEIKVLTVTPESNLSAESKSLYITKDAADDLVQILGKYLLALE
jgi:hypothetical protein